MVRRANPITVGTLRQPHLAALYKQTAFFNAAYILFNGNKHLTFHY